MGKISFGNHAKARFESASIGAVVTVGPETAARLGVPVGTEVDLGTIAYYHKNPIRRLAWGIKQVFRRRTRWLRS